MKFLNEFMAEAMDAEAMKDAKEKERQRRKAQKEEQNERRAKAAEERAQINARKGREEKNKQADEDEETAALLNFFEKMDELSQEFYENGTPHPTDLRHEMLKE